MGLFRIEVARCRQFCPDIGSAREGFIRVWHVRLESLNIAAKAKPDISQPPLLCWLPTRRRGPRELQIRACTTDKVSTDRLRRFAIGANRTFYPHHSSSAHASRDRRCEKALPQKACQPPMVRQQCRRPHGIKKQFRVRLQTGSRCSHSVQDIQIHVFRDTDCRVAL